MRDKAKKLKDKGFPQFLAASKRNLVETLVSQVWEVGPGTQWL